MAKKIYIRPEVRGIKRSEYQMMKRADKAYKDHQASRKKYTSPKAEVYKSKDLQKAQKQTGGGRRSYRPTPKFSTSVMSAVSLLLVIGLIATVFFAYENSTRAEGEAFQYFSPAKFLEKMSSSEIVVNAGDYEVDYIVSNAFASWNDRFTAYVNIDGRSYKSTAKITRQNINSEKEQFYFKIGGVLYGTYVWHTFDDEGNPQPMYDKNGIMIRKLSLPDITFVWNEMPDFDVVISAWRDIENDNGLFNALSATFGYISDFISYEANVLTALLPWNSVTMSNEAPVDNEYINIPWRKSNGDYIELS